MKIREIVVESTHADSQPPEHVTAMSNVSTLPNQNMYHGSGYLHSTFLRALAGAGAGNTPSENMGKENFVGGDPMVSPYHEIEEEMIDNAMQAVGDTHRKKWGARNSHEPADVHRTSPIQARGPVKLNKK
jgi:hypothetical protein